MQGNWLDSNRLPPPEAIGPIRVDLQWGQVLNLWNRRHPGVDIHSVNARLALQGVLEQLELDIVAADDFARIIGKVLPGALNIEARLQFHRSFVSVFRHSPVDPTSTEELVADVQRKLDLPSLA